MRSSGVRGVLIYCADYQCSHWTKTRGDQWSDDVRLSDIEDLFICSASGKRGADVRPDFDWEEIGGLLKQKSKTACLIRPRQKRKAKLG